MSLSGKKAEKNKHRSRHKNFDEVHDEKIREFTDNINNISSMHKELAELEEKLAELDAINNADDDIIDERTDLRKEITKLKNKINNTESCQDVVEYFGTVGDIVYEYYDSIHGNLYGMDLGECDYNRIDVDMDLMELNDRKTKKRKKGIQQTKRVVGGIFDQLHGTVIDDEDNEQVDRAKIEIEYLKLIDRDYVGNVASDLRIENCPECGTSLEIDYTLSESICPDCGYADYVMIPSEIPANRENYAEKTKYPYKRLGHFKEKLNLFLCKNNVNIPKSVTNVIKAEMAKYAYTKSMVTMKFIKDSLKKNNLSSYYNMIMYIYCKIKEIKPFTITQDEYDTLVEWFVTLEEAYMKYFKPTDRKNFLRYPVVLNRLFIRMGKKEHAKNLNLLKNPKKMNKHTKTINIIFKHLGWDSKSANVIQPRKRKRRKKKSTRHAS
jgi:DNA repair exonuclease SbcCD ATPase subunit